MTRSPVLLLLLFAIRTAVITGCVFGLFIFIGKLVDQSSAENVALARGKALSSGLIYGVLIAVLLTLSNLPQWQQLKRRGSLDPAYRERLLVRHPYARAEGACRTALRDVAQKGRVRERDGVLLARSKPSWTSWGERLSIELTEIDENTTHVRIACEPILRTTVTDYGRGAKLVDSIRQALSS